MFLPYSIISLAPYGEKKFDEVNLGFMVLSFGGDQNDRFQLQSVASLRLLSLYRFTKNGNKIQGQKANSEVTCDITYKAIILSNSSFTEQ